MGDQRWQRVTEVGWPRLVTIVLLLLALAWASWLVHAGYPWGALAWVLIATLVAFALRPYASPRTITFLGVLVAAAGLYPLIPTESQNHAPEETRAPAAGGSLSSISAAQLASPIRVTRVPVGIEPFSVAEGGGSLWVANESSDSLSQVDVAAGRVVQTIAVPSRPVSVAATADAVWVASNGAGSVSRVDAETGRVSWTTQSGPTPAAVVLVDGSLWAADATTGVVLELNRRSGEVVGRVHVPHGVTGLSAAPGSLWAVGESQVSKVDTASLAVVTTAPLTVDAFYATFAAGGLWLSAPGDDRVLRVDPDSMEVTDTLVVGEFPTGLSADAKSLWVATTNAINSRASTLGREPLLATRPRAPNQ